MTARPDTPQDQTDDRSDSIKMIVWVGISLVLVLAFAVLPASGTNLSFWFYTMMWLVMASAFNFVAGLTGYMPFGYVVFYGVGAYATGILYKSFDFPILVALAGAGVAGILVALLMAPTLRLRGVYFGIVSLALAMAVKLMISLLPSEIAGGSIGLILASANDPVKSYYVMVALLAATLAAGAWLSMSSIGISLRAIRDDREAAEIVGINVTRVRLIAWTVAAMFPALAGGAEAWYTNAIDLESSFNLLVTAKSIVYAMAGGLGYLLGPIVGTLTLYGIDQLIWRNFPTLNLLLLGLAIIVMMLVLPRGIVGGFARRFSRFRRLIP